jgi:hypothetical protein
MKNKAIDEFCSLFIELIAAHDKRSKLAEQRTDEDFNRFLNIELRRHLLENAIVNVSLCKVIARWLKKDLTVILYNGTNKFFYLSGILSDKKKYFLILLKGDLPEGFMGQPFDWIESLKNSLYERLT